MCVSAGRGRDEESRLLEAQEDPSGAEHRQDGKKLCAAQLVSSAARVTFQHAEKHRAKSLDVSAHD